MGSGASSLPKINSDESKESESSSSGTTVGTKFHLKFLKAELQYFSGDDALVYPWALNLVELGDDRLIIRSENGKVIIGELEYAGKPRMSLHSVTDSDEYIVSFKSNQKSLELKSIGELQAHAWLRALRNSILLFHMNDSSNLTLDLVHQLQIDDHGELKEEDFLDAQYEEKKFNFEELHPPRMNIVILVVGTRGDVQPFVYLGQALKRDGHRVRIATHSDYRNDVTIQGGLEYYPLAGREVEFRYSHTRPLPNCGLHLLTTQATLGSYQSTW